MVVSRTDACSGENGPGLLALTEGCQAGFLACINLRSRRLLAVGAFLGRPKGEAPELGGPEPVPATRREELTMRQAIIHYKVKPVQVESNLELVRGVYEELAATQPDGFRYATFQLEDGVNFMHVAFMRICDEFFPVGTIVRLEARPAPDSSFLGWRQSLPGCGDAFKITIARGITITCQPAFVLR